MEQFNIKKEDFGFMLICSVRYAITRNSYAPTWIIDIVKNNIDNLNDKHKITIIRTINETEFKELHNYKYNWLELRDVLESKIDFKEVQKIIKYNIKNSEVSLKKLKEIKK